MEIYIFHHAFGIAKTIMNMLFAFGYIQLTILSIRMGLFTSYLNNLQRRSNNDWFKPASSARRERTVAGLENIQDIIYMEIQIELYSCSGSPTSIIRFIPSRSGMQLSISIHCPASSIIKQLNSVDTIDEDDDNIVDGGVFFVLSGLIDDGSIFNDENVSKIELPT